MSHPKKSILFQNVHYYRSEYKEEGKKKKLIITFGNSLTLFVSCKLPQVDSSYVDGDKNFSCSQTFSYFLAFCNARFSLVM